MHPLLIELELEHHNLRKILLHLEQQVERLHDARDEARPNILLSLEYLHLQPATAHHNNEERITKALAEGGTPLTENLLMVQQDHSVFDQLVNRLITTIGKHPESRRLPGDVNAYLDRYRRHMAWEEQHLLPLADEALENRAWARVEDAWIAHPDPVFGPSRNSRFIPLSLAVQSL